MTYTPPSTAYSCNLKLPQSTVHSFRPTLATPQLPHTPHSNTPQSPVEVSAQYRLCGASHQGDLKLTSTRVSVPLMGSCSASIVLRSQSSLNHALGLRVA